MSMLSELQGSKHIRPLDGRAPSVAANIASYDPQEGDNGLVLLAKLLKRMAAGILLQALPAGESVIGKTVGVSAIVTKAPTLSVGGAAATGDYVGASTTPESFANAVRVSGSTGVLKSITITDKLTTAAVDLELWLFSATFTAPTDNAAWAISDADQLNCLGVIELDSAKWYANSNGKVFTDHTLGLVIKPAATSLFFALVARGTTPAWATGDLQISLGILQD